jgi:hypothetical protein
MMALFWAVRNDLPARPPWLSDLAEDLNMRVEGYEAVAAGQTFDPFSIPGSDAVVQKLLVAFDVKDPPSVFAHLRRAPLSLSALSHTLPLLTRCFSSRRPRIEVRHEDGEEHLSVVVYAPGPISAVMEAQRSFYDEWVRMENDPARHLVVRVKEFR